MNHTGVALAVQCTNNEQRVPEIDTPPELGVLLNLEASGERTAPGLELAQARLAGIIDSAMDAIITVDANQTIQIFNRGAERAFGCAASQAIGRNLTDFMPARFRQGHGASVDAFGSSGVADRPMSNRDITALRADGTEFPAEAYISQVEVQGERLYTVILRDITERTRAQEILLESKKLESLSVLAGGVAHDFNNLLLVITGNAELALLTLDDPAATRELLEAVVTAGRKAAELSQQMLAYSGKGHFVNVRMSLSDKVERLRQTVQMATPSGTRIEYELAPGLPPVVGDESQLRQMLVDLVTNAQEALSGREGVIHVRTGLMWADEQFLAGAYLSPDLPPGDYVYVEVTDTGIGMTPDVQSRIFDPFFSTKFAGRGLGLAATLGIMRGHKGAIHVESEPGKGSRFRVLFPPAPAD